MQRGIEAGRQTPQSTKEANKRPERLSDEEMGNLVSALGNHEAKTITLLAMQAGIIYPRMALWRRVMTIQGSNTGWKIGYSVPYGYCEESLSSPLSLVTREVLEEGGLQTYGYMKTDYGVQVGESLAGLLLDFSRRYPEVSLQDIFANTSSSAKSQTITEDMEYKKRAPITRLKIFWELLTSQLPIREADLVEMIEEQSLINHHLRNLGDRGIILYETAKTGEPFAFYTISPNAPGKEPSPYSSYPSLTHFVYQALQEDSNKVWTSEALTDHYIKTQGLIDAFGSPTISVDSLKHNVSGTFTHLMRAGYAQRGQFSNRVRSEINLTPKQGLMLLDLVTILDKFQNQDPEIIALGRRYAQDIMANPVEVSTLMRKAKEHSSAANRRPTEETAQDILYVVNVHPNSDTAQIQQFLEEEGRRLGKERIREIVRSLVLGGKIEKTTQRDVRRFRITQNESLSK